MESQTTAERGNRKKFAGTVVSDRMNKTRVVEVKRLVRHPFYDKVMKKSSRFSVHDENNESHTGDVVEIAGTRPLSRTKRWRVVRVIKTAPRLAAAPGAEVKS
ncbi:MAG: 30S ribosomal protein S17 [Elusimicrobiota bacterium]|jgi:small subunit ribosomal protein S17